MTSAEKLRISRGGVTDGIVGTLRENSEKLFPRGLIPTVRQTRALWLPRIFSLSTLGSRGPTSCQWADYNRSPRYVSFSNSSGLLSGDELKHHSVAFSSGRDSSMLAIARFSTTTIISTVINIEYHSIRPTSNKYRINLVTEMRSRKKMMLYR